MFKVESGIPMPDRGKGGRKAKYPLSEMKIGDSFFVPKSNHRSIRAIASRARQRYGIKLTTRTVTENGVEGIRVWRIE